MEYSWKNGLVIEHWNIGGLQHFCVSESADTVNGASLKLQEISGYRDYPPANFHIFHITMENGHISWETSLFRLGHFE